MSYIGVQPTAGQYRKLDDISGSFNGSTTTFTTQVGSQNVSAGTAQQLLVSLGGVIQNPITDYTVSTNSITFTTAPASGLSFFAVLMGEAVNTGTPSDGTVTGAKLSAPFNYNSGLLYLDSSNNRVGVSTTSPTDKVTVAHADATGITFKATGTDGTTSAKITFEDTAGGTGGVLTFDHNDNSFKFATAGTTERARIDSSGRLLVGTSTALTGSDTQYSKVQIQNNTFGADTPAYLALTRSGSITSTDLPVGRIFFGGSGTDLRAEIAAFSDAASSGSGDTPGRLVFSTTADGASSPTERMRITNKGQILHYTNINDWSIKTQNQGNSSANYGISIWSGTDAATGTNYAVEIADGDGTAQGYITFTGGTVTYGAFTAHHPCILPDADNEAGYPYGTLLEIINIEYTQKDGKDTERGILYNVRKTQAANSRAVLGAYGSSMNGGPGGETNRHQALVLGDGHILCNNSGGNIKVGDGICSSATPGIGQKATATPSMAIGIAQEDVTFADDEEVKLVAVQYGVRQFIPWGD